MKRLIAILLMLATLLMSTAAFGYGAEIHLDKAEELPQSILAAIPNDMTFVMAEGKSQRLLVLLESADGARQAFFFHQNDNVYTVQSQSVALPVMNGEKAYIGFDGKMVFVRCGSEELGWHASFEEDYQGNWMLANVDGLGGFTYFWAYYDEGKQLGNETFTRQRYVYGAYPFDRNLATMELSQMPNTTMEAIAMLDTDGHAMMKSDGKGNRLHLRASASKDAPSYGRYYSGTPVIVHSLQGDWAKVSIGDRNGYMMREFLAFGEEMKTVDRHFPSDHEMSSVVENPDEEVLFYAKPRTSAKVVASFEDELFSTRFNFVADIDDDWFQVIFDNGLCCYVQKKFFWGGNG